jgi:hypothetical protein
MVTDEERDYMYRVYAHDPRMRINVGIRRRLAPLLGNNRREIELLNGLLLSLPGTPVIYYGDEIGMGDNIYLGDRNGVRTPMQWDHSRTRSMVCTAEHGNADRIRRGRPENKAAGGTSLVGGAEGAGRGRALLQRRHAALSAARLLVLRQGAGDQPDQRVRYLPA